MTRRVTVEDLDDLVNRYREMNLPEPPTDLPLVADTRRAPYLFGYLVDRSEADVHVCRLWIGTQIVSRTEHVAPIKRTRANVGNLYLSRGSVGANFSQDLAILTAALEHMRGNTDFALMVLEASPSFSYRYGSVGSEYRATSIEERLVYAAAAHWRFEASREDGNLEASIVYLEAILDAYGHMFGTEDRTYLRRLKVTVENRYRGDDADEKLIDDLCDSAYVLSEYSLGNLRGAYSDPTNPSDQAVIRIIERGFDIVPALLRHLDDERLTRAEAYTVGQTCGSLIGAYGGSRLEYAPMGERSNTYCLNWWEEAKGLGEREMAIRALSKHASFPYWSYGISRMEFKSGHSIPLIYMLQKRNPDGLFDAIDRLLAERIGLRMTDLFHAAQKIGGPRFDELVRRAVQSSDLLKVCAGLEFLLDSDQRDAEIVRIMQTQPGTIQSEAMPWFALVASQSSNPDVWRLRGEWADRSDTNLTLSLLSEISEEENPKQVEVALHFLACYLEDEAETESDVDWFDCHHTFPIYDRVGDEAAYNILRILEWADSRLEWSSEQWDAVRGRAEQRSAAVPMPRGPAHPRPSPRST